MKKLNLNDTIKVKLTDKGMDILKHRLDNLNDFIIKQGGSPIAPYIPEADSEGFTEFQLWKFMNIFGEHFENGMINLPIESLNIYIDDKYLVDIEKKLLTTNNSLFNIKNEVLISYIIGVIFGAAICLISLL